MIGLNLCPFAAGPYRDNRVYFCVTEQRTAAGLLDALRSELVDLYAADPLQRETTLLIHPWALIDFMAYNDFLEVCDTAIRDLGLEGELQVASFHPQYQFADTQPEDIENFTNRSPYPMLHSVARRKRGTRHCRRGRHRANLQPKHPYTARTGSIRVAAFMARLKPT